MPLEIERKFLVTGDAWRAATGVLTRQGYLGRAPGRTVRVRVAGDAAWLTIKGITTGITRAEFEYEIPQEDARELLALCAGPLIEKTRHIVHFRGFDWEVDEFHGANAGLVVAEIELASPDQAFERPAWLGAEVTEDRRYANSSLVDHPFSRWAERADGAPTGPAPATAEAPPARVVVLETARLFLREATADDAEFLLALLNEPAWLEHIGDRNVHSMEASREYIATRLVTSYRTHGFGFYVMELKVDGAAVGVCGLAQRDFLADVDIGYALLSPWWGQGYALEATRAVLEWARDTLKRPRVLAIVSAGNTRSTRLLAKLGLNFERQILHPPDNKPVDLYS